jgi:hypothetical protein
MDTEGMFIELADISGSIGVNLRHPEPVEGCPASTVRQAHRAKVDTNDLGV